jgi:hypothetical protein
MSRALWRQDRRMQKFRDVLSRWERRELSQLEASELLGYSECREPVPMNHDALLSPRVACRRGRTSLCWSPAAPKTTDGAANQSWAS